MTFPRLALLFCMGLPLPSPADDLPVITLRTPAAQMKYDSPVITAAAGLQVKLVFENKDDMPHNFVLCQPLPDKNDKVNEFQGIPLAPVNGEAVIYRNFITDVGPRGIAVGYPNGVNLCFDADQMAPALFWQGAFIDAKRHWTNRGSGAQPPLGYHILKPTPLGPAVALLPQADAPWPSTKERADMLRFRGYRLDAKRFPTFKYEMGSVTITEAYQPAGSTATNDLRLTRSLYFLAPEPQSHLYVRVAAGPLKADREGWVGAGFHLTLDVGDATLHGENLLVPVVFTGGTATVAVTYHWTP